MIELCCTEYHMQNHPKTVHLCCIIYIEYVKLFEFKGTMTNHVNCLSNLVKIMVQCYYYQRNPLMAMVKWSLFSQLSTGYTDPKIYICQFPFILTNWNIGIPAYSCD